MHRYNKRVKKRIECTVFGRVQMVMYRDFATRNARHLGVVGAVKNNEDGTVMLVGEGEEEQLHALVEQLKRGSLLARVDRVDVVWKEPTEEFKKFTLLY